MTLVQIIFKDECDHLYDLGSFTDFIDAVPLINEELKAYGSNCKISEEDLSGSQSPFVDLGSMFPDNTEIQGCFVYKFLKDLDHEIARLTFLRNCSFTAQ